MIDKNPQCSTRQATLKSLLVLIAVIILNGFVFVPTADAQNCPAGGMVTTGPIDLISCTETQPGNSQSITLNLPAVLEHDILIAVVQIDEGNNNDTILHAGGYWTALGPYGNAELDSQMYYRTITAGDPLGPNTFNWTGNNERSFGYVLQFRGAIDIFDAVTFLDNDFNDLTPSSPALTTTVDNTLVLRTLSVDRFPYNDNAGNPGGGFTLINSDNTGNGNGGIGGASGFLEPVNAATLVASADWALTGNGEPGEQTQTRTLGIRPYAEFRIHTEAGINVTNGASSQCAVELITLRATDRTGTPLTWFTGTVTMTSDSATGVWTNSEGAPGPWSNDGGGAMTYTFNGTEGGVATFQYFDTVGGDTSVNFGATDSTGTYAESTQANYTPTPLLIRDCEYVISYEGGSEIGTCGVEQLTISVQDTAGNPATSYSGTMTINNNNGSGAGTYAFVSGSFGGTFTDLANGQATYAFTITPTTPGTPHTVVLDYTHESTTQTNLDFLIGDGTLVSEAAGNPILTVTACEIRISYTGVVQGSDALADTCQPTEVTISVVDETGTPITGYTGTIRITNDQTIGAWSVSSGTIDNASGGGTNNGQADYTYLAGENGVKTFDFSVITDVGPNIDLNVVETSTPTFVISPTGIYDADVDILPCTWDLQIASDIGTCVEAHGVTVTIRGRDTNPVTGYIGQIQISSSQGFGDYALVDALSPGGLGTPDNGAGGGTDNGVFTYTFDASDNGFLDLELSTTSAITPATFTVTTLTPAEGELAIDSGAQNVTNISDCDLVITLPDANLTRNVCTNTRVQFEVQVNGSPLTNFDGVINLTADGVGKWFENAAETYPGALTGGGVGDGTASYDFNGTEGGNIIFDFREDIAINDLDFGASGVADNGAPITLLGTPPQIDIFACTLTVTTTTSVSNIADVCRGGEEVTFTLSTPGTTNFDGTMVLQTSTGFGNYVQTSGASTLVGPGGNDGFATYTFDPGDGGVLTVDYSVLAVPVGDDVTFTPTIPDFTVINTDGTLTFRACEFRISYPSDTAPFETDVCSIKQVQIEIVDGAGSPATVTDYTGTINITTSTGFGSWAENPADNDGTLTDPFGEDGAASYTFVGTDNGVVLLNFTHTAATAPTLNINVTDSVTSDPGSPGSTYDPNLLVDLCTFQVSYDGGGLPSPHLDAFISACEIQQVTIEVYDSTGAVAVDYEGQVNISTSTNNGNWAVNTGTNALTNVVVDGGAASYLFDTADDGVLILDFSNLNAETLSIDLVDEVIALAVDGVMVEEGAADPNLEIGSCIPAVDQRVCGIGAAPSFTISLPITAQNPDPNLRGRMVVVGTGMEGPGNGSLLTVSNVQFNGVSFNVPGQAERLIEERIDESPNSSYSTMWAMNEQLLPTAAASYNVEVFHNNDDTVAACAFFLTDVEQTFPAEDGVTPNNGAINATGSADNGVTVASTTITTTQNNALILSIVSIGNPADTNDVSPSPPMTNFSPQPTDPGGAGFGGADGNASNAAAITIDQTMSINPTFRHTHVVGSFNPLISGPPQAEGYEPVVLFKTYSGNISYRAIGAANQTSPNGAATCNVTNTASATLTLPDVADGVLAPNGDPYSATGEFDSDIRAAWLYWFASGSNDLPNINGGGTVNTLDPTTFDNVTLTSPNGDGMGGTNVTNLTADGIFFIENVSGFDLDYYAAYKDVTNVLVGSNNELIGSDEDPNGTYTVTNMALDSGEPWLGPGACAGGFALVVVYENPYEQLRVINLFHGFQPFLNSAFTLVPRNFRIADRDTVTNTPNGQVTHITIEGDATLSGVNEGLTLQTDPANFDPISFAPLTTDYNPADEEFNGTITRPVYTLQDIVPVADGDPDDPSEFAYIFQPLADNPTTGLPSNGYELDFPNPAFFTGVANPPGPDLTQYGTSYGVDIDTHFIDGDDPADPLFLFADPLDLAEEITTRYSADGDLVMLVSEIISVTNDDIADIEVTITEADAQYKVNSTGTYNIVVSNNGSGAAVYGTATGIIELVGELPTGMTLNSNVTGTGWTCSTTGASTTAFTCTYDASTFDSGNGLGATPLPTVSMVVDIAGPPGNFPSLNNDAKVIVRVQHNDGSCLGGSTGVLPTPSNDCEPPEFDNVNDLQGGAVDINDLEDKTGDNNNVDSITTNIEGIETDLSVVKAVTTILEEGSNNGILYTITVTNNGPDDLVGGLTQPSITITDNEPVGVNFDSASGTDWTCNVNGGAPDQLVCTFDNFISGTPIPSGGNTVITVVGDVTGTSPDPVTNTVQVTSGTYNFDNVPGNNTFGTTDNISPVPAAVTDRFLLSVSAIGNVSLGSGGGLLSNFNEDDIVLYDPVTDSAELFIDSATTPEYAVSNPNAIHLLPNGQVVMSANDNGNEIGTNDLMFDKDDIIVYDRLLNTATLLFDGSALITDVADGIDLNIDSVYVHPDGRIIFSTAGPASDGGAVSWSDSDLVVYDPVGGTFAIYLEAEDDNVFDAVDAQVDAAYIRIDTADATMVLDTFVVSSAVQGAVLGDDNVIVGRDDVAEIEITGGTPSAPTGSTSTNLFNGGVPVGVFDTTDPALTLNGLHLIEPAHLGHYEISEVVAGNACTPARIRIRKHLGTSHDTDTDYTGSIVISTDSMPENGIWVLDTGQGTLDNMYGGSSDNGQALYTFYDDGPGGLADDDGEVILTLDVTESTEVADSVNLSVTNGFTVDGDTADNPFVFNLVSTDVDYRDDFEVAGLTNSDGSAGWSDSWTEIDAFNGASAGSGSGMMTGNIQMTGGKLRLSSNTNTNAGSINPSMARPAGPGFFDYVEPIQIEFDYGYQSVTDSGDVIEVQISSDGIDSNYITVQTYNTLDGTSVSDIAEVIDISSNVIQAGVPGPTEILVDGSNPNIYVRFEITQGYVLGTFTVDNFRVTTSTTDCNTGGLVHYHIDLPATGIACVTSNVTITGHDAGHNDVPIPNGTVLNLTTSNGSGSWVNRVGTGTLSSTPLNKDGQGTYTVDGGDETSIQLQFNYTDPAGDGAAVSINVSDGPRSEVQDVAHDPSSNFSEAGLVFFDQDAGNLSTTLPFQIAGKPSLTAPASGNVTLQIVRSTLTNPDENAAAACESLVDDGDIVTVTFAGLCVDPAGCDVSSMTIFDATSPTPVAQSVPVFSSPTANPEAQVTATALTVEFSDLGAPIGTDPGPEQNIGAPLNFIYPDAGKISLHAQYEIPFDNDIAGTLSGDTINGGSETFIVRPFGFDIDFDSTGNPSNDRGAAANLSLAADENGPAFARAGVGFNATVSAVLWEQADDVELADGTAGNDGIPDFEADLSNNPVATNFGDELGETNTVEISIYTTDPTNGGAPNPGVPSGATGTMVTVDGSSDIFQSFGSGVSGPQFIAINEVGIFDLRAQLVDDNIGRNPINYFEETPYVVAEGIDGGARNVGRIYPNNFELISSSFGPRVNQEMVCAMASPFTYLGEDFGINFELQAKNFQGTTTANYFGNFAKLTGFTELDIRAIVDVDGEADVDYGSRIVNTSVPVDFSTGQPTEWLAGAITLSGDLNLARLASGEDGPLTDVQISFRPIDDNDDGIYDSGMGAGADNDVLLDVFNVELDDNMPDVDPLVGPWSFAEIGTHEFRYGRLIVENSYGSEFEDLDIVIAIQYWDGTAFVVNTADSCTAIVQTFGAEELTFVPGSYESDDAANPFEDGDTVIEQGAVADVTLTLFEGQSNINALDDADGTNDDERPFTTTAPANEEAGRVLVEFDLDPNDDDSPTSLHFLEYDWRGGPDEEDIFDEQAEGANYEDNPRGLIEFGSYSGHDRVINWQEIYIGPTP